MKFERPTTCRYYMPHVVAYVVPDVVRDGSAWQGVIVRGTVSVSRGPDGRNGGGKPTF
jgi:hypothetical protein